MYIVRARPVTRSIQSGGVGRTPRSESANEFEAFPAAISPVRFQATTATARSAPAGTASRCRAARRRARSRNSMTATAPTRIPKTSRRASVVVKYQGERFSHCRIESPGASE